MLLILVAPSLVATVFPGQGSASAQEDLSQHWDGLWQVEGSLFQIRVAVEDNVMKVTQVESMGFEWTSKDGEIEGNVVRVEVEYAGITGIVQAELIDANTGVAIAATCTPEFMVVCALSKNRQAVFRKIAEN